MSEYIRKLRVALQLDSAAFEKGAKRSAAEVEALGTRAEKMGHAVGRGIKLMAAAGTALAGSALVATLKDVVTEGLEAAKALKIAAQTANAGVAEFQMAAIAAKSVGIESDKLADIYKDVNDKFGEFLQTGGGEMKDFFDNIAPKVGVTADMFRKLSGPEALQLYYDSLVKAGLGQKEMTFYMEKAGDGAFQLVPVLKNGGAEMKRMGEEARKSGRIMSDEMADKAVEAGKKLDQLTGSIRDRLTVAVGGYADEIGDLADRFGRLIDRASDLYSALEKLSKSPIGEFLSKLQKVMSYLTPMGNIRVMGQALGALSEPVPQKAAPARVTGATSKLPFGWTVMGGKRLQTGTYNPGRGPLANLAGTSVPGSGSGGIGDATGGNLNLFTSLEAIGATSEQAVEVISKVVRLQTGMKDSVVANNAVIARSFKDMAEDTISAFSQLAGAIKGGGFLNILSSLMNMGLKLGSIGLFGSKIATNINSSPQFGGARAMGGPVFRNTAYMVGERGPELFVPSGSGAIVPNHKLGGGVVHYHISGNLMTPEFWQMIRAGDMNAARAGAMGGAARVRQSSQWALR